MNFDFKGLQKVDDLTKEQEHELDKIVFKENGF